MLKSMLRKREGGFTLVELMIVVAIIGVLAALAIYGVSRYLKHSKTAEATRNLAAIETGSKAAYQLDTPTGATTYAHQFCMLDAAGVAATNPSLVPDVITKVKATKYTSAAADWAAAASPWQCLKFSIQAPQFYQYSYGAAGTGTAALYTAIASGDLDGNGTASTFTMIGGGTSEGDARRTSFVIVNEDE